MQDEDDDPSKKVFYGTNRCTALTTLRHLEGGRARTMAAAATEAASSSSPSFCSWTIKLSAHALHCTCARSIMPLEKQCSSLVFCLP